MPTISVIVPVYNAERWLRRCVDSILAQTFTDFELLLIDDGSTDASPAICDDYAALDPRVRTFHQPNGGVSSARNLGLDNARGEWIGFIDSDDWVERKYLYTLVSSDDGDLNIVNYSIHKDTETFALQAYNNYFSGEGALFDFLQNYVNVHIIRAPWGKAFKRNIIEAHHLRFIEDIVTCEDTIFVLSYCINCRSIRLFDSALYNYEFSTANSNNSLSRSRNLYIEQYKSIFKKLWSINEDFKSRKGVNIDILISTYIKWIFFVTLEAVISSQDTKLINVFGKDPYVRKTIAVLNQAAAFGLKGKITLTLIQNGFPRTALFLEKFPPKIGGMKND